MSLEITRLATSLDVLQVELAVKARFRPLVLLPEWLE